MNSAIHFLKVFSFGWFGDDTLIIQELIFYTITESNFVRMSYLSSELFLNPGYTSLNIFILIVIDNILSDIYDHIAKFQPIYTLYLKEYYEKKLYLN